ncbi:hypothetical protein B0T19DRAFT_416105 [Cercophora scortea]|uniref:Uncharacterized protein n=1 Tax=Cercophora scortea TaxID=314031 RepID=A0AAE0MHB0_9PEZI|nr:hypothetical protein B0T19DRAFT_416105 [Cercophora scortea]
MTPEAIIGIVAVVVAVPPTLFVIGRWHRRLISRGFDSSLWHREADNQLQSLPFHRTPDAPPAQMYQYVSFDRVAVWESRTMSR